MKQSRDRGVRWSAWLGIIVQGVTFSDLCLLLRLLSKPIIQLPLVARLHLIKLSINFRLGLLKLRYRLCLCRKCLILSVRRRLIRLNLLARERKLVAKHGANWRLRVFDNEVIEFLELVNHAHSVMVMPNGKAHRLRSNSVEK